MIASTLVLAAIMAPTSAQGAVPSRAEDAPALPPNAIVIVSDDCGYMDFGFQGSKDVVTPNLDALRASGVRFARAYVTGAVCSPSRAALITGRYQQRFGHEFNPEVGSKAGLPPTERTLAERLKAVGYTTSAIGKWHLGQRPDMRPLTQGFDSFHGFLAGSRSYKPLPDAPARELQRLRAQDAPIANEAAAFSWLSDHFGKIASEQITALAKGPPYFMYLAFNAAHSPMEPSPEDLEAVGGSGDRAQFRAMVRGLDRAVGVVLAAVEASGEASNTIMWFVNDNGGATNNSSDNGDLRGRKGSLFEGGIRVPMVLRWPGVAAKDSTVAAPVSTLDIAPTLLAAAGAPIDGLDGKDLQPLLVNQALPAPHDALFWRNGAIAAMLECDRWKLIRIDGTEFRLFDLVADPSEKKDLAPESAERVKTMAAALAAWESGMIAPTSKQNADEAARQLRGHRASAAAPGTASTDPPFPVGTPTPPANR